MTKRGNALWFFVAFFGGGIAIWWTKTVITNAWFAAMVASGVVFTLGIYYLFNDKMSPEEKGDNIYYLGLLFTLISLIFSLVELFGNSTDAVSDQQIRVLLENFGIALTSTVAGIAGRVALLNWQRTASSESPEFAEDPVIPPPNANAQDLERFNRHLLGRIARDLTQGANALARFHRIVRSHATDSEDYLHSHSEMLKRESDEFKDTLKHNVDTFTQELKNQAESTLQAVGGSLNAVAQQAETLLERLQSAHDGYLAEVRETTRSFHNDLQSASSQNLDALQRNFDAATKQSRSLAEHLSTANVGVGDAFDKLKSSLRHASDASTTLGNNANQAAKSTAVLEATTDKLHIALEPLHANAGAIAGILNAISELDAHIRSGRDTKQTAEAVQQIGETLRTITTEAAATTEHAARAAKLIDALTGKMQTTEGEAQRAEEALRVLAREAEAQVENLHYHQNQSSRFKFWDRNR